MKKSVGFPLLLQKPISAKSLPAAQQPGRREQTGATRLALHIFQQLMATSPSLEMDQPPIKFSANGCLVHRIATYEDDFLMPAAPDRLDIILHQLQPFQMIWPYWGPQTNDAALPGPHQGYGLTDFTHIMRACRQPEEGLATYKLPVRSDP